MGDKSTTAEFIEKAKQLHGDKYDYSKSNYIKSAIPLTITCPEHGDFEQRPNSHLNGSGCKECAKSRLMKPISTEDFIKKCIAVHGDKYDYSKVVHTGARNNITIICPEHGEFEQTASRHSNGRGCQACGGTSRSNLSKFIEKAKQLHGDKYDYSKVKYATAKEKVTIICEIHGEFEQAPSSHLSGQGCRECGIEDSKLTIVQVLERAKQVHGDKYDYSNVKYDGILSKVRITCPVHGEFEQLIESHLQGAECRACNGRQSRGEKEMIAYIKTLVRCDTVESSTINGTNLELDVYLPDLKLAFEYNGVFTHSEYRKSDKYYHANKTKLCADAGIRLVHIWEDDWRDNNEIERKFISNLLVEPDKVIYARKTKVMEIDQVQANRLLVAHHIQGSVNATRHIGLFSNGELVAVGSFTHRPTGVELVRYASSIPVIGGLGKVCKHHGGSIYTFCDIARFTGESYIANGFVEQDQIGVDYKYVVSGKRVHKFNFRKKAILRKYPNVEPGTELEMTKSLNIHRIWDCGKVRYIFENN